ncbi:DUF6424 family protein, partial [Acinetobacter baumannii]
MFIGAPIFVSRPDASLIILIATVLSRLGDGRRLLRVKRHGSPVGQQSTEEQRRHMLDVLPPHFVGDASRPE